MFIAISPDTIMCVMQESERLGLDAAVRASQLSAAAVVLESRFCIVWLVVWQGMLNPEIFATITAATKGVLEAKA